MVDEVLPAVPVRNCVLACGCQGAVHPIRWRKRAATTRLEPGHKDRENPLPESPTGL